MMRAQLEDCRTRGDLVAYLWASESTIYGRFGYGLASRIGAIRLGRDRSGFAQPFEQRGTVRLVGLEEAARTFPALYDQVTVQRPGMFQRSNAWWETRKLFDDPARRQGGPLNRALLELDGQPAGYALYRVQQDWQNGFSKGAVTISEVVTPTAEATRELWRWLLDFDWTSEFVADLLPLDHPLFLLLAEPRRMQFTLNDGVWVRLVDVPGALAARSYAAADPVVLELVDALSARERWPLARLRRRRRTNRGGCRPEARRRTARLGVSRRFRLRRARPRLPDRGAETGGAPRVPTSCSARRSSPGAPRSSESTGYRRTG